MTHNDDGRYMLQSYDRILVVASWGEPKRYVASRYVLEVERAKDSGERRSVVKDDETYHSSTTAIRDLLYKKLDVSISKIDLLIFCQDTIVLDRVMSSTSRFNGKKRGELREKLLSELYEQKREVTRELGISDFRGYDRFVRFVPGVITRADGAYLFTWRTEHCYDLLLGGIILHTFRKLKEGPRDARRIAILVDTTHGINYFATALKEGVLRAATLYAFDRLVESVDGNGAKLEELVIYHYNSDPLSPESRGTPSLKMHMLDKVAVVKNKKTLLNRVFATIEEYALREGLRELGSRLGEFCEGVEWRRLINTLLLLSRGLLVWALRIAREIGSVPSIEVLENSLNELELKIASSGKGYKIDYKSDRKPLAEIVEYTILANTLGRLADKVACTSSVHEKGFNMIEKILSELRSELIKNGLYNTMQNMIENRGKYVCFNLRRLRKIVELMYTSPYREVVENEIENLESYLTEKEVRRWRKENDHVYAEPNNRPAYLVMYGGIRVLISIPNGVDSRVFYAHGGLAYGLPWFALSLREENIPVLYLGEPERSFTLVFKTT